MSIDDVSRTCLAEPMARGQSDQHYVPGQPGHHLLRESCSHCSVAAREEDNLYVFCRNSSVWLFDALGLVSLEDCQAQLNLDMAKVASASRNCASEVAKSGIVGVFTSVISGGIASIVTGGEPAPGIITGLVVGGGWTIYDICKFEICMRPVRKQAAQAKARFEACRKKAEQGE